MQEEGKERRQEEGTRRINPQSKEVSATEIQNYLKGVDYPADKNTLVETAREQGAPEEVVSMLERLPEEEYDGPQIIMQKFGQMGREEQENEE